MCIKKLADREIEFDFYSSSITNVTFDLTYLFRKLIQITTYIPDSLDIEPGRVSIKHAVARALISGGSLLLIISAIGQLLFTYVHPIIYYSLATIIYTIIATLYFRRKGE